MLRKYHAEFYCRIFESVYVACVYHCDIFWNATRTTSDICVYFMYVHIWDMGKF